MRVARAAGRLPRLSAGRHRRFVERLPAAAIERNRSQPSVPDRRRPRDEAGRAPVGGCRPALRTRIEGFVERSANRYRNEGNRGSAMVGFRVARVLR